MIQKLLPLAPILFWALLIGGLFLACLTFAGCDALDNARGRMEINRAVSGYDDWIYGH